MHRILPLPLRLRHHRPLQNIRWPIVQTQHLSRRRFASHTFRLQEQRPPLVRFRASSWWKENGLKTFLWMGLATSCILHALRKLEVELDLSDEEEEAEEIKLPEPDKDGVYWANEESLFIPMTWMEQMPRTFYKGSDPEWLEFIKLGKDTERQNKVRQQLAGHIQNIIGKHPVMSTMLGPGVKSSKAWLNISYPEGPPPDYQRSGIEFGDGYVAWCDQKVPAETHDRVMRAMWPKATFNSVWAGTKILVYMQYARVWRSMGWEVNKDTKNAKLVMLVDMLQQAQAAKELQQEMKKARLLREKGQNTSAMDSQPLRGGNLPLSTDAASQKGSELPFGMARSVPLEIPVVALVFQQTMKAPVHTKPQEAPRGSVVVQGMVQVTGPRGSLMVDVRAFYSPKTNKFGEVRIEPKQILPSNQQPKGGP